MASTPSTSKIQSKKTKETCKERDRLKTMASEPGGSSQCDTSLLTEPGGPQKGFTGIGPESVICMGEQVGAEMNTDAATNLAEDVSYKLQHMIRSIALQSQMLKKTCVDSSDVNTAFKLSDTSPIVGACPTDYTQLGDQDLHCPVEELINVPEYALTLQTFEYASHPTMSVEWITEETCLNNNTNISATLQNYYTKIARAILNLRKDLKEVAVQDLLTNTRIGPIFPNLFNLAVLVLNDDNLNALNVPAKKPLQSNVLDMVDALCSNPCSLDTNIQQQFQRLFPVMVSNILGNGSLAEKMVAILTKITRTWPSFISIGKSILFDYLSQGTKERLTAPMIKCVIALGRTALIECLEEHLEYLDDCIHAPRSNHSNTDIRETILDVATCLLRSEPTTYVEDYVTTDYALYIMLGDSIIPRRTIFPITDKTRSQKNSSNRSSDEDTSYCRQLKRPKLRLISTTRPLHVSDRKAIFNTTNFCRDKIIRINIRDCKILRVKTKAKLINQAEFCGKSSPNIGVGKKGAIIAGGFLQRFLYKTRQPSKPAPYYAVMML